MLIFRDSASLYRSGAANATALGAGPLVVLEGIDGSGTTTQLHRVAQRLRASGHEVVETREPSDGPVGRHLRSALRGEVRYSADEMARLFAADRMDHLATLVEPALARGAVVLSDRYVASSLVYQSQFCAPAFVRALNARARPAHLTLVLAVPPEVAQGRRATRGGPAELYDDAALQARLARAYEALPTLLPGERVVLVDGAAPIESVTEALCVEIDKLLVANDAAERPAPTAPKADADVERERKIALADEWLASLLR